MQDTCEIVTSHVALELHDANDTIEHITEECPKPAYAVVEDTDGDEVTVCRDHVNGNEILYTF